MSKLSWVPVKTTLVDGRWQPSFGDGRGFSAQMWFQYSLQPSDHQWRSYTLDGDDEVARVLLSPTFQSHSHGRAPRAILLDAIEVRADLQRRGLRIGLMIVQELMSDARNCEIYAGPTVSSAPFWEQELGWPRCACPDCDGRNFVVWRP